MILVTRSITLRVLVTLILFGGFAGKADAQITQIVIDRVESPAFGGRSFGTVGQYERLVGRAIGEVDPADPRNAVIVDIQRAPRNARGNVEYDVDVDIIKPMDMERGNRTVYWESNNRGGPLLFGTLLLAPSRPALNQTTEPEHAGDGLLMRHGFTLVWSGWHADEPERPDALTVRFPIARNANGSPIREWITQELILSRPSVSTRIGSDHVYPPVESSIPSARLLRRAGPDGPDVEIPRDQWSFADCSGGGRPVPSKEHICLPSGFSTDYIYNLVYEAQDPFVSGLGYAATRDLIEFLRRDASSANPLASGGANPIRWAMMFGASQSGRFLRNFLYDGFNEGRDGSPVVEGMLVDIAGSRLGYFNHRFARTTMFSRQTEQHFQPNDEFPFTYETLTDPISGRTDGLLRRCRESNTCPNILQSDDAYEMWQARASLVYTDPTGTRDVPPPSNVRYYLNPGTEHTRSATPTRGICQQLSNPNAARRGTLRALTVALQAWISAGKEPPASSYPRLADGTLVRPNDLRFPAIPGVKYNGAHNHKFINDFSVLPPRHVPNTEYAVFVPTVDADGNDIPGIRSVELEAPLATFTGWNLRQSGFIEGHLCQTAGSYIPFARTAAERGADPRPSLQERYGNHQGYVAKVREAANNLVRQGYLLPEDRDRAISEAEQADIGLPR